MNPIDMLLEVEKIMDEWFSKGYIAWVALGVVVLGILILAQVIKRWL